MNRTDVFASFAAIPERVTGSGATEAQIEAAESALAVKIRGGYREYLMRFGWGGACAFDIYGIGGDAPPYLDLIRVTISERTEMEPQLPTYLLPLMNDGGGNLYCLDTRVTLGEPPIVLWCHDEPVTQIPAQIASNFTDWLATLLEVS